MKPATSIEKVCRVLDTLRERPAMGVTEVARQAGLLPSDAHRIVKSLEHFGYVEQETETRRYRLGLELLKLGHLVHARMGFRDRARPFLRCLAETTGATANMAIFDPRELAMIFVEQIHSDSEFQIKLRIGSKAGAHSTAVGKVLLAHLTPDLARQLLKRHGLRRVTKNTITSTKKLTAELETVRAGGYAADREEAMEGAFCIAAPVRDHTGDVVAAASVSTVLARVSPAGEKAVIAAVKKAAKGISAALGYPPYKAQGV